MEAVAGLWCRLGPLAQCPGVLRQGRKEKIHLIEKTMYPWPSDLVILKLEKILLRKERVLHSHSLLDKALHNTSTTTTTTDPSCAMTFVTYTYLTTRKTQFHYRVQNGTNKLILFYFILALSPAGL